MSRLVTLRRIEDLGHATLDLYEHVDERDIDATDRAVLRGVAELLALLSGLDVRRRTVRVSATALAMRRVELSRDLNHLLSEDPG